MCRNIGPCVSHSKAVAIYRPMNLLKFEVLVEISTSFYKWCTLSDEILVSMKSGRCVYVSLVNIDAIIRNTLVFAGFMAYYWGSDL